MKKSIYIFFLIILLALLLIPLISFITKKGDNDSNKKDETVKVKEVKEIEKLTVSIAPQKFILEKISGNKFDIKIMLPKNTNPNTFTPLDKDMQKPSKALGYFKMGNVIFERKWMYHITTSNLALSVFDFSKDIKQIEGNQYIWLSVKNLRIISLNAFNSLVTLNKENKSFYLEQYNKFLLELDELDKFILKELKNKELSVSVEKYWAYLLRDYDLNLELKEIVEGNYSYFNEDIISEIKTFIQNLK